MPDKESKVERTATSIAAEEQAAVEEAVRPDNITIVREDPAQVKAREAEEARNQKVVDAVDKSNAEVLREAIKSGRISTPPGDGA
jgi:hypothetical protein